MTNPERVHWFLRDRCNFKKRCAYCFGPFECEQPLPENDLVIAQTLVENQIPKVVLSGGNPTVAKNIDKVIDVLSSGGVSIDLHINGSLLTTEKLDRWEGRVDSIALPIDAADKKIQESLRGKQFAPVFDRLIYWAEEIHKKDIKVGWHTVFTAINDKEIQGVFDLINTRVFEYWRIYELNFPLAHQAWLDMAKTKALKDEELIDSYERLNMLIKRGTKEKGFTDGLAADFLRMEEKIQALGDKRIQCVATEGRYDDPYMFIYNSGRVGHYAYAAASERGLLGNLFEDGWSFVVNKWQKIRDMEEFNEDEFVESILDRPLWAREHDGQYFLEELDEILPEHHDEYNRIQGLWMKRNGIMQQA